MKKPLRWVAVLFAGLIILGIIDNAFKSPEEKVAEHANRQQEAVNKEAATSKGYVLQSREAAALEYILKDEVATFLNGGDEALLSEGLMSVTAVDVAKAYNDNEVAADQKYFKKPLFLTGKIKSINSGLGNEPYISLFGLNDFLSPQVRFNKTNIEKISSLKKGEELVLVCDGAGSVAGTPMFKNCQFSDDYANQRVTKLKTEISKFLDGKKPLSEKVALSAIFAIAVARSLPENSTCFNGSKCGEDFWTTIKDKGFEGKMSAVASELKSAGLQVPNGRWETSDGENP